tara:strand:+ start:524 stop:826 length:303 start_codon:yes stop_codon:yes gene_type:complete
MCIYLYAIGEIIRCVSTEEGDVLSARVWSASIKQFLQSRQTVEENSLDRKRRRKRGERERGRERREERERGGEKGERREGQRRERGERGREGNGAKMSMP